MAEPPAEIEKQSVAGAGPKDFLDFASLRLATPAIQQRPGRQMSGGQSQSDAEAEEEILKPTRFAGAREIAPRAARHTELPDPTEPPHVSHI